MKLFQKIFVFALVAVLALSMAACGAKKDAGAAQPPATQTSPSGSEAEEIVSAAPGKLLFIADVEFTLGYDNNGAVLALTGDSDVADTLAAQCNVAGKTCANAIGTILTLLAKEHTQMRGFVTIRQELGSVNPSEDFMSGIAVAVQKAGVAAVVISLADMDETGYFNQSVAEEVVRAYFGDQTELQHITAMYEGRYVVTIKEGNGTKDYAVSALTGTVTEYTETTDEPYDETMDDTLEDPNDNPNEESEEEPTEETTEEPPAA